MSKTSLEIPDKLINAIGTAQAWHYKVIPKEERNGVLVLYTANQEKADLIGKELSIVSGRSLEFATCSESLIQEALFKYYRREVSQSSTLNFDNDNFLETLINEAIALKASDIHIEKYEDAGRIRFRIDGKLVHRHEITASQYPGSINKIKIKANLDIAERRLPQDGRIQLNQEAKTDLRISILPTFHGEKVVIRILSGENAQVNLDELGMNQEELKEYLLGIQKSSGIVLVSGPTGSGKTTTLYATLKILNKTESNIMTVEDPIEYTLEGVNQIQVKENIGLTFAKTLRSFLRQDPDIIMVGEIRDKETAELAVRAALTGHLVLSTIHTNSAIGTINRLIDMGIPNFLVADTLNSSVAQRLVRKLCPDCKVPETDSMQYESNIKEVIGEFDNVFLAHGCPECNYTGYRGRTAIYEILPIDENVKIKIRRDEMEKSLNFTTLKANALTLVKAGITSIAEIHPILINE